MYRRPRQLGNSPAGIRFAAKSVRSGLRRYPRALLSSLKSLDDPKMSSPAKFIPESLGTSRFESVWFGHASVLTQICGSTVLVDPVLTERIGVQLGSRTIGLPRLAPVPVHVPSLRGVDIVLITHAHFDHLDRPTLRQLAHPNTTVFVPIGCRSLIPNGFERVIELAHDASAQIGHLDIQAIEPAHWGARRVTDRHRRVNAYVVGNSERRVLFAGDSAETDAFDTLSAIDLAIMGIGAYDPWEHMHATPEQVWAMFQRMDAQHLLPIHHSTFELSDEPIHEPMQRLRSIAGSENHTRIVLPKLGTLIDLDRAS